MKTVAIKAKELKGLLDAINGAACALAHVMSGDMSARNVQDDFGVRLTTLRSRVSELVNRLEIERNSALTRPEDIILSDVQARCVRFSKGEYLALSGSAFRKYMRDVVIPSLGVEIAQPETVKKEKTERVSASELAEFRAWKEGRV